MFDTMTMTKVLGGVCGTFLVFLLGGWAADIVYSAGEGGHGDEGPAYVIASEDSGEVVVEEGPSFMEVYATADAAAGERVFRKCAACHAVEDGANGTGPHLYGVVDRAVGAVDGYAYSGALTAVATQWDAETLSHFLENPKGYAPGTAMSFSGLSKVQDRADVIAYLNSIGG